jgi:hypothetical protein
MPKNAKSAQKVLLGSASCALYKHTKISNNANCFVFDIVLLTEEI